MKTDATRFARRLLLLRAWERDHIPFLTPLISLDVLLLAASTSANGAMPVKSFHLALNHSQDRVREVIKQLVEDDWLRLEEDSGDGRVKSVRPTEKLLFMLSEYERSVREMFDAHN